MGRGNGTDFVGGPEAYGDGNGSDQVAWGGGHSMTEEDRTGRDNCIQDFWKVMHEFNTVETT